VRHKSKKYPQLLFPIELPYWCYGPVVQPGMPCAKWAKERPVCKASSPENRKAAGSNPARSTTIAACAIGRMAHYSLMSRVFLSHHTCCSLFGLPCQIDHGIPQRRKRHVSRSGESCHVCACRPTLCMMRQARCTLARSHREPCRLDSCT